MWSLDLGRTLNMQIDLNANKAFEERYTKIEINTVDKYFASDQNKLSRYDKASKFKASTRLRYL